MFGHERSWISSNVCQCMPMYEYEVLVEEGIVSTVTINRPERRNALTVATTRAIAEAIEASAKVARAIVLTGAGEAFSAGGDFGELVRLSKSDPAYAAEQLYAGFQSMILAIRRADVPVIAAINGHAMGAGMDLALACDMRVASADARLGQVWVKVGIIPGTGGAYWVTQLAGPGRAAQMILTGEPIDALTALDWGLVNEVVPSTEAVMRATQIAEKIAANPPGAVAANKRALDETIRADYEAALSYAKAVQPARFASEEFKQALSARA